MRTKRTEAKLVGYNLFYDLTGKLVTERTSTDIKELKKFFTPEEYNTLATVALSHFVSRSFPASVDATHLSSRSVVP